MYEWEKCFCFDLSFFFLFLHELLVCVFDVFRFRSWPAGWGWWCWWEKCIPRKKVMEELESLVGIPVGFVAFFRVHIFCLEKEPHYLDQPAKWWVWPDFNETICMTRYVMKCQSVFDSSSRTIIEWKSFCIDFCVFFWGIRSTLLVIVKLTRS